MNSEYKFKYKHKVYLIRVSSDIACRGGKNGKGTVTYVQPLNEAQTATTHDVRGYQGRHSKAGIIRVIKSAINWES